MQQNLQRKEGFVILKYSAKFSGMAAIPTKQRDLDIKLEKMNFRVIIQSSLPTLPFLLLSCGFSFPVSNFQCLYLIVALFGVYNAVYWTAVAVEQARQIRKWHSKSIQIVLHICSSMFNREKQNTFTKKLDGCTHQSQIFRFWRIICGGI